ncbi:LysR family transcriptional regulator [Desulfitobacterium chlororespirans]|uniref:DNA-binding transcriptional regulator, LysR family n=1 Tax=Desulfitobacterium chlororespirans DSM 11544 TaxID=1121395 RepID=A0A1M7V056_9FIRM|nr:LysR family transcriptional regulator [Desulfitobacterium chlororespirans]SHN88556.1 DNA-binding transcriptional regulator, LysR family [Desulfitobacterium chlororespirans DSM 11544]
MDTYQLKIFIAVSKFQSISKAAKVMHLSQPAVSTHIKNLEEYYRGPLFERTQQGVSLTKAGQVFYTYAQRILTIQEEMEQQLEITMQHENNQIIVGASTTIGNVSLPCSIYLFKEEYPEVNIRLEIANAEEILRKVKAEQVDFGVVEILPEMPGISTHHVTSDELVLIVPPAHPAPTDKITLKEFLSQPLIMREPGSGTHKVLAQFLEAQGYTFKELNIITEMTTIDAIKSAVQAGMGGAVVPRLSVKKEVYQGSLRALTIMDLDMPLNYNIIKFEHHYLSSKTRQLIKFLTDPEERFLC